MTIIKHEWKQGRTTFALWTAAIGLLLSVCVFLFPEMKGEVDAVGSMFASMGSFTEAFGMDQLNFGTLLGFYAIECGNVLGLGGAIFAALMGTAALCKEEKGRTVEFLLTHPIARGRVVTEKWLAVMGQIIAMNLIVLGCSLGSMALISEAIPWREILLLHLGYLLMQWEVASICFGLSAFLRRSGVGVGLGLAAMLYFLNLIANMAESADFLKYITPFGYCEGADVVNNGGLDVAMVLLGVGYAVVMLGMGGWKYCHKDIS